MRTPIVFLHGFLGSPRDWNTVCAFFPDRKCITVNLPGHADTPFTTDFTRWMPSCEKFHLVGYSLGGRLALQYARIFPHKIASLTLASSHLGLHTAEEKQQRLLHDQRWAEKLLSSSLHEFLFEWYRQPIFGGFRPDLKHRLQHEPNSLAKTLLHYSLAKQEVIKPPPHTLILVGERDEKYRTLHPDAKIIPLAAHMVHLENPQAFAQFLSLQV